MQGADLARGKVGKTLLKLALPSVVAQLINLLYNLVDRMFVGAIPVTGTDSLAGLGVCFPVLMIVSAFSALVGIGGAPLVAVRLGEKKTKEAEAILTNGFVMLLAFGAILTAILLVFGEELLILFGAPASGLPYGKEYLAIYAIGTLFVMIALGLNPFISTQGYALIGMGSVAIGAVLNIALDPLFIFVFDMGVKGAALATILSQAASAIWVLSFFFGKRTAIRLRFRAFRPQPKIMLSVVALGISPFIMQATESAVQIVFNVQLTRYTGGDSAYTAALTIMLSVMQMIALPLNGLGTGAQPLISFNYGAGNFDRVRKAVKWLFVAASVMCLIVWTISLSVPQIFAVIFSAEPPVAALIRQYMPVFMMGTICFSAQFAFQNTFLALVQTKVSYALAVLRKIVLLIPLTFLLPLRMGTAGIFYAEGIADLIAGTVTAITFLAMFRGILRRRMEALNRETVRTI